MPRHLRLWAACALAALALGCATKKRVVDPSFTVPEGTASSELELITFLDRPTFKIRMIDKGRIGKVDIGTDTSTTDQIALDANNSPIISAVRAYPAGTVRGLVLNRSAAEGIEVFRTEPNGAVRRLFDVVLQVTRRWIDGLTEMYEFADTDGGVGAPYIVRGLIGGNAGPSSPLSNSSRVASSTLVNIVYTANRDGTIPRPDGSNPPPADSTFDMRWDPVPGAARYLIQVFEYQPVAMDLRQQLLTGVPAPLLTEAARDIFIATIPATTTTYKLGNAIPGSRIYTYRTPRLRAEYFVRIAALDANNEMIGLTVGPTITKTSDLRLIGNAKDFYANFTDPEAVGFTPAGYLFYSRAAVRVSPREVVVE